MSNLPLAVFALFCTNACITQAYDWGNNETACVQMKPFLDYDRTMQDITDETFYRIKPNVEKFHPGQKLYIRIKGKTSEDRYTYTGLLLTVKQDEPVGKWGQFHKRKYKRITCGNVENAAIVEANNFKKVVGDDVFIWEAPSVCDPDNKFYELTGTIVKSKREYLIGLSTMLECMQGPPEAKDVIEFPEDACAANFTVLPDLIESSFEIDYGGWWNSPMAALRWSRHKGPTESLATGPHSAANGRWYIYTEASYPAEKGDMAILNGPFGMYGCFCIRLKLHANIGKDTVFEIAVNDEVVFSNRTSDDAWMDVHASVNHPGEAMVQLRMTRGNDFRGDIAVDMVSFTPGRCENMEMMEENVEVDLKSV